MFIESPRPMLASTDGLRSPPNIDGRRGVMGGRPPGRLRGEEEVEEDGVRPPGVCAPALVTLEPRWRRCGVVYDADAKEGVRSVPSDWPKFGLVRGR